MKRICIIIGLIILLLLPTVFLSCSYNEVTATLGQEFTLPVGKTAIITGQYLSVKFVEVEADSRCPNNAQCIWAGEARFLVSIKLNYSLTSVEWTVSGREGGLKTFNQYSFTFTLEPYPEVGQDIAPSDYYLVMTVTK
jgi:hypothetical protein